MIDKKLLKSITLFIKRNLECDFVLFPEGIDCEKCCCSTESICLETEKTFSERLLEFIDKKGISDSDCYKKAGLDRRLFSKIRSNREYQPKKPTAIALAIGLELDLKYTNELLESAGYTLSKSSRADRCTI